ncbi:hypothetical protein LTS10_013289 [Elasticomyces elasticus]|nr:hypothetical protein LTS10_013289 [Elasticomyces elasticus]
MEAQHRTLTLYTAMNFAQKNRQMGSALGFANALIEKGTNAKFKETVSCSLPSTPVYSLADAGLGSQGQDCAERSPSDALDIDFDPFTEFDLCGGSFTPIYAGDASSTCPFDGTKYLAKYKGTVVG